MPREDKNKNIINNNNNEDEPNNKKSEKDRYPVNTLRNFALKACLNHTKVEVPYFGGGNPASTLYPIPYTLKPASSQPPPNVIGKPPFLHNS